MISKEELIKKAQDYCSNHLCREGCEYYKYCGFESFGVAFAYDALMKEFRKEQERREDDGK